ncbi:MAG: DUF3347 domain-containing protein, partial [Candidatus Zixiibacteriota bacterium]
TNGAFKLDSELQIQAKPSMMSPEGGGAPMEHQHGQSPAPTAHEALRAEERRARERIHVGLDAVDALTPIYTAYFAVQSALAADDLSAAVGKYKEVVEAVTAVPMSLFTGEAHNHWMELSERLIQAADDGASAQDLDAARRVFINLSSAVIDMQQIFGHTGTGNYYLTFCPMANDNKGAYWLQEVDTVYNPFFGASMLHCGEIKEALPPAIKEKK